MGKTVANVVSAGLMIVGAVVTGPFGAALIAAGMAVQFAASQMYKPKLPMMGRDQSERKQMLRSSTASETVVIGHTVASGLLFFAEEEPGEQDENERITLTLALAGHPIEKIGRIWLGDDPIESFGGYVEWELHNGRAEADPFMLENCPSWKPDMIGRNMAWLRVTLKFDAEKFPYGLPNIKCEVWGKKLHDPRTGETRWSNNGALVILDYYRSYLQVPDSDIDWEAFKRAADICSEGVDTPDGGREPRYALNGAYELEESPSAILDAMHRCLSADPTYMAGKHGILVGAYNGPAVLDIHESQIIDTVTLTPEVGLRDATNAIYGTFVDAEQIYTKTDFPPIIRSEWVAEDGLEIKENIDFRFVTSPYQAQRLAHQYLRRKRLARRVQLKMNLDGYAYRPGQVVRLNLPTLGITDLEFRVIDWRFSALDGAELTLEEDGAYVYEDVIGKPFERPPFTRLPVGGVGAPMSLSFIPQTLGDVIQGILSWRNVSEVAFNRVTIYQDDRIIQTIQVPGESVNISGLVRGNYRAEVRAVNAAGAMSAPAVFEFSIQAPPPPVNVEITPGFFSLTIVPRQGDVASFGHTFEFWFSEKQLDFTHESMVINHADRLGQGNFWIKDQLKAGTTYWFYVRTINTYGKSPFIEGSGQPNDNTRELLGELGNKFMTAEAGK
ncbi:phage tail tip protein J-related protein, partial [Xenorhabdus griffiniae]